MKLKHVLPAAAAALCVVTASAQNQAPGLWEHSMTMKSADMDKAMAELQAKLAAMPPDQRKQVEQAMAGHGMSIGAQGLTTKVCISKEQAARAAEPHMNGDCTTQDLQRSGSSISFKYVCTKPRASSGEGQWTFNGDKAYTGKLVSTTQANGKSQAMTMDMTGKWLSSDCSDIKPIVMPAK